MAEKLTREQWLEQRRKGIGGSDAAKVLGASRWGGPLTVYFDKVEGIKQDIGNSEAVHFGTKLEDFVAREFMDRTGIKVRRCNKINLDKEHDFILANVDRVVVGENKGLEIKTASAYKGDEWKDDELPDEYYCQCQHYCRVMEWEGCWIACLIGGQHFVHKYIPRNDAFINEMVKVEVDFWENNVLTKSPPAPTYYDTDAILEQLQSDTVMLNASDADLAVARKLAQLKVQAKELDQQITEHENILKARIGEHEGITGVATWRTSKDSTVTDWKAIANIFLPGPELVAKYTSTKPGPRRFLLKLKEKTED